MSRFTGGPELIIILIVIMVLFGGSMLPKIAKNIGEAQKELKKSFEDEDKKDKKDDTESKEA